MVNINLLPWRGKRAQYEKRLVIYMVLVVACISLLVIISIDRYFAAEQQAINEQIENLKKELRWRQGLAHQTQPKFIPPQENLLNFFTRLNEANSRQVCFEQIKKSKSGIEFLGWAYSAEQLTTFLRHSSVTSFFAELKVNQLQQQNGQLKFNLIGKLHAV